jgi:hypothetical protein
LDPSSTTGSPSGARNPAVDQRLQERAAHPRILGRGLHEAQEAFLARCGHAERDHHLIVGEVLAIQQQLLPLGVIMAPLLQLL